MLTRDRKKSFGSAYTLKTLHFRIELDSVAPSVYYNATNEPIRVERTGQSLRVFLFEPALRPLSVMGLVAEVKSAPIPLVAVLGAPTHSSVEILIQGCAGEFKQPFALTLTLGKLTVDQ